MPQRSVLGSLLWDVGYDAVFHVGPPHTELVYYADDTLILSGGRDARKAAFNTSLAVAAVSQHIATLGLTFAA